MLKAKVVPGIILYSLLAAPLLVATVVLLNSGERAGCGNDILEQGETPQNCCEDTGCLPSQSCTNHSCTNIACGYCEYAANETCHKYECCADAECGKNETCSVNTNKCAQIECECGYTNNRTCVEYECCNNRECPSGLCNNNKCAVEEQKKDTAAQEEGSGVRRSSGSESNSQGQQVSQQQQQQAQQQALPQPQPTCTPTAEVCDGLDNNCNGLADDGITCDCSPGQTKSCGYNNVGLCKLGTQVCQSSHIWGSCTGQTEPSAEACDNKDNDCNSQVDEGSLCQQGQICMAGNCKTADTSYKVQPVIFFPTDYANDQDMVNYLKDKFEEIRQFYLTKAGTTFTMLQPQVVSGDHSHEWYWCVDNQAGCVKNNFEASIIDELKRKGFPVEPDWNKFPANRVTWVAAFGGGGYAGGRFYPTGGGLAIVGDAGIYAAKDGNCNRVLDKYFTTDNPPNAKDSCKNSWLPSGKAEGFGIGALGHELGHALNLPHPDGYSGTTAADWEKTLIGYHWNYPNTGLLEQDKARLAQSPFINTKS
ncbi:hypothetical protein HYY73_01155 [Candidatus Woesearchaeota archaeon]|nr:hypothetical protein [Candidatus Woesearchaeota archaeon]